MSKRLTCKLIADMIMTMLLLTAFAHQLIGNLAHEIVGSLMVILFITHNMMNRRWYASIFKGKYPVQRVIGTAVNLMLFADMALLAISAVMISRDVFSFLDMPGGLSIRGVHVLAAHWGLVLVSVHLGLHWSMILGAMKKMAGMSAKNQIRTITLRIAAILIAIYGIKSSFDLEIGSKLTMQSSYGYWDFDNAPAGFFIAYLSIMSLYVFITYYGITLLQKTINKEKIS